MDRKFWADTLLVISVCAFAAVLIWCLGDLFALNTVEQRWWGIKTTCGIGVVFWLLAFWSWHNRHWLASAEVDARIARRHTSNRAAETSQASRVDDLVLKLRELHGWRWRYRDRWVVVAGDEPLVKRLAPGLPDVGYAIVGEMVLLYAKQIGDRLDTIWLDEIRRVRRRRPVDALVSIVRTEAAGEQPFDTGRIGQRLYRHARALRWAAPVYLLNVTDSTATAFERDEAIGCTWSTTVTSASEIGESLRSLTDELADAGVVRLTKNTADRYPAELSQHIARYGNALSKSISQIARSRIWRSSIHGVLFTPLFKERATTVPEIMEARTDAAASRSVWQMVASHSRGIHGRRVGFSLSTIAALVTTAGIVLWTTGTLLSGVTNRVTIQGAAHTVTQLSHVQDRTQAALTLDHLQKQLDTLEVRQHDGAPWYARFGLNRDTQLFAALWPIYESGASSILVTPVRAKLEERLRQLASLSDAEIACGGNAQINSAYGTLKTYLMLAKPERANASFLTPELIATQVPARPVNSSLSEGAWQDLSHHLVTFYANHLGQRVTAEGTSLAIIPDASLIAATRQTIIGVRGIQNSTDTLYQQIIDDAKAKYPPVSLAALLGDTSSRGLFNTTATIPGVFTRAAWDERISKAIDDASEQRNVAGDWVLSDTRTSVAPTTSLKADLRQRYFDDYARAWQLFLNGIRWQPTPTLSGTVDQLTLLADPQRSPLVALMNAVVYQAGTGAATQSLSDTLLNKAQQLVGTDEKDPSKIAQPQNTTPLAAAFAPLLRLTGSDLSAANANGTNSANSNKPAAQITATGDLSLARFLERVTAMRLKLQQIMMGVDPDAMSRAAAQSVLQGKTSDIADSQDYASRVAASLGEQWAGFGTLFEAPLDQTWRVVLQPAASSLNDTWRTAIVADWDKTFAGRYPFADSENDASLPEMSRFMRPDNGVIAQFVTSQLAGIVERQGDHWVAVQGAHSALTLDPAFLPTLNKLARVSTVLFPSGDAHVGYELRAVPTPGVTDMKFVLSGRELHYFNQKEEWTPFVWPGDALENITHVQWQTEQGGLRSALDAQGRFGLIRLLERATLTQQDSARYLLSWKPDQSLGLPLNVQLRSEAGAGPLDVLALRHFSMPSRIFVTGAARAAPKLSSDTPPPLPPAAVAAAKHAAMPLPHGEQPHGALSTLPEVE